MDNLIKKTLIIIDPGLMTASGHHAGFATFIANSCHRHPSINIEYICHKETDTNIIKQLNNACCIVKNIFKINFYEMSDPDLSLIDIQPYIKQCTKEFSNSLQQSLVNNESKDIIFFYPSLRWEHALSLSFALKTIPISNNVKHIVSLIFNPGIDHTNRTICSSTKLNYHLGFNSLKNINNVKLFASDSELSQQYSVLLDNTEPLPLHPNYLADWKYLATQTPKLKTKNTPIHITLYMGDAKIDKGFCKLPSMVTEILHDSSFQVELYIQYTNTWKVEEITEAEHLLKTISEKDSRLILEPSYLSDNSLHHQLQKTNLFTFTYEQSSYLNKSSGFLWLAAWHKLPILFLHSTWLIREASRLGVTQMQIIKELPLTQQINSIMLNNESSNFKNNSYWNKLYSSFLSWIKCC